MLHLFIFIKQDVPLLHAPVEVDGGTINIKDVNNYGGKGYFGGLNEEGGAALGGGINTSTMTAEEMRLYRLYNNSGGQIDMDYAGGGMMTGQQHFFDRYRADAFDGMALSEEFLGQYYASVSK